MQRTATNRQVRLLLSVMLSRRVRKNSYSRGEAKPGASEQPRNGEECIGARN